ncbi:hypothetical protein BDY17DRAFT_297168 [Neohortaea acidophila]|uniref:SH3 domain-containing protein n=1 Tax=Neohortaea acidophila TaxID=245834 RepID=A0A6A6PTS1_9PEZI|nr:uncharacterized protein BDY17DRAFT_297168 [Neohortaea acidophila]KAF2483295.1 hypothetical protein BDY17DRAFT_297168 [Neohortaea acidophila]
MGGPSERPLRFPCWCQATYSYGGETKKDLGFVEGDLIEALNAGDGSWWMGRLRRDPRAIGLFPSNFVRVLDESFQPTPASRTASPSVSSQRPPTSPAKSSVFRKPFQAYDELGKRGSLDNGKDREGTPDAEKKSKFRPYSSMKTAVAPTGTIKRDSSGRPTPVQDEDQFRVPAPLPRGGSRSPRPRRKEHSASPAPMHMHGGPSPQPARARNPSSLPNTYHDGSAYPQFLPPSRQPSPEPFQEPLQPAADDYPQEYHDSRMPSPAPFDDVLSSPPPPPPAHRIAYQPSRPASPQPFQDNEHTMADAGRFTPIPRSPGGSHMTPSPLRDAMNDVMSSLHGMSMYQEEQQANPYDDDKDDVAVSAWSPEAFDLVRSRSRAARQGPTISASTWAPEPFQLSRSQSNATRRPQSSLGFARDSTQGHMAPSNDDSAQLETYVQRMEQQLYHETPHGFDPSTQPPAPPQQANSYTSRPTTSGGSSTQYSSRSFDPHSREPHLRHRKSAYELGHKVLGRTNTTRTNATNSTENSSGTQGSSSTQLTSHSVMSGHSAGGFSATSAGSLARKRFGLGSQRGKRPFGIIDTKSTPDIGSQARSMALSTMSGSGPSYHQSHGSVPQPPLTPTADWSQNPLQTSSVFGGLGTPTAKKSNFFKKMISSAKTTARTGTANARSTIGSRPSSRAGGISPTKSLMGDRGGVGFAGDMASRPGSAAAEMGLGGVDWMQVRRDVNRSNSLSGRERVERDERCQMLDIPVLSPVDHFLELVEGNESLDGLPVTQPTDFNLPNLALVDKSTRFLQSLPSVISAGALAQNYICRPYRSDVQRLRAIFTFVAERIAWEEDFEGDIDIRRAMQTRRACSEEIALVVREMCSAVGLHAEVVQGYLKAPGEATDMECLNRPNHWWNTVIIDGEWRILDCSLANPTNPRRSAYSSASGQVAEGWYFLARPVEACYTHVPLLPEQQHVVPPVPHEILAALPCACPTYFKHTLELANFDTSMLHLENLEMAHLHVNVPEDVECVAEVEAKAYARDIDGDCFESGDTVVKKAFAQAEWVGGRKRFTVKALLPGDEGAGVLKVYAGKRGLMHSIKDNPHSLALALPLSHHGPNPPYEFVTRHPTPHAQRHDLYIAQPQCSRLAMNNTFVFCVRQHPSSLSRFTPDTWGGSNQPRSASPNPYVRPTSAMSMISASASQAGSNYSDSSSNAGQPMTAAQQKPAKLAIQTPSQKIIRLTRKSEHSSRHADEDAGQTSVWETAIKIGERGTWRGLVLADRSARWCVFAEWECV